MISKKVKFLLAIFFYLLITLFALKLIIPILTVIKSKIEILGFKKILLIIGAGGVVTIINLRLLAVIWAEALTKFEPKLERINKNWLIAVYVFSNSAKYIPSSVAQYFSKAYFLNKKRVSKTSIVNSFIIETLINILTYTILIGIGLYFSSGDLAVEYIQNKIIVSFDTYSLIPVLIITLLLFFRDSISKKIFQYSKILINNLTNIDTPKLAYLFLLNSLVYLFEGFAFTFAIYKIDPNLNMSIESTTSLITALGISSILGYLNPLTPSGMGFKEALLILLLKGKFGIETVIIAASILRISSILSELLLSYIAKKEI